MLYDALDVGSLRGAAAARARARLAVGSALFGLLRADDPVPAYRLSAGSALPGRPTLAARWKPLLEPVLAGIAAGELVVDLRSGSYAALGRLPGAVRVDVLAEHPDGRRTVVSHFNKAHKGRLARILASTRAEPTDAAGVAAVARRAGLRVERRGTHLTVDHPGLTRHRDGQRGSSIMVRTTLVVISTPGSAKRPRNATGGVDAAAVPSTAPAAATSPVYRTTSRSPAPRVSSRPRLDPEPLRGQTDPRLLTRSYVRRGAAIPDLAGAPCGSTRTPASGLQSANPRPTGSTAGTTATHPAELTGSAANSSTDRRRVGHRRPARPAASTGRPASGRRTRSSAVRPGRWLSLVEAVVAVDALAHRGRFPPSAMPDAR